MLYHKAFILYIYKQAFIFISMCVHNLHVKNIFWWGGTKKERFYFLLLGGEGFRL